jgi:hypothetical protein
MKDKGQMWDAAGMDRVKRRMATIDAMPKELRALVHEHGLTVIQAFVDGGLTKPKSINHIIDTIRRGSGEIGPRESNIIHRKNSFAESTIDEILNALHAPPIAVQIINYLLRRGKVITPTEPTEKMIQASMDAVNPVSEGGELLNKRDKHKRRLRAALKIAVIEQMTGDEG